jgi:hypothetical protein
MWAVPLSPVVVRGSAPPSGNAEFKSYVLSNGILFLAAIPTLTLPLHPPSRRGVQDTDGGGAYPVCLTDLFLTNVVHAHPGGPRLPLIRYKP